MSEPDENQKTIDRAKAQAEVDKLEVDAAKAKRGAESDPSVELETRRKAAAAEKEIAENEAAAVSARAKVLSSLVPDLSKIADGTLTAATGDVLLGSALSYAALGNAAKRVASEVVRKLSIDTDSPKLAADSKRAVLITTEADFLNSDAAYVELMGAAGQLCATIDGILPEPDRQPLENLDAQYLPVPTQFYFAPAPAPAPAAGAEGVAAAGVAGAIAGGPVLGAVAAAASAVPQVLSLLASNRSITTSSPTADQVAAAAAVAGELAEVGKSTLNVMHDTFRLFPSGDVVDKQITRLRERRRALALYNQQEVNKATAESKALLTSVDAFLAAIFVSPGVGKRSPVVDAKSRVLVHEEPGTGRGTSHVLLIRAANGSAAQLLEDKPLWLDDKFSVLASSSVTYLLLDCESGLIVSGGTESGAVNMTGKAGSNFEFLSKALVPR